MLDIRGKAAKINKRIAQTYNKYKNAVLKVRMVCLFVQKKNKVYKKIVNKICFKF